MYKIIATTIISAATLWSTSASAQSADINWNQCDAFEAPDFPYIRDNLGKTGCEFNGFTSQGHSCGVRDLAGGSCDVGESCEAFCEFWNPPPSQGTSDRVELYAAEGADFRPPGDTSALPRAVAFGTHERSGLSHQDYNFCCELEGNDVSQVTRFRFDTVDGSDEIRLLSSWSGMWIGMNTLTEVLAGPSPENGADLIIGTDNRDILRGGDGFDVIYGNDGNDDIFGGRDTDQLYGMGGEDHIEGRRGDDSIDGGTGVDTCIGGPGVDTFLACETVMP